jgi:hypothetical protein
MRKARSLIVLVIVVLVVAAAWLGRGWLWRKLRELHGARPHHADAP